MKLIQAKNYQELSEKAAEMVIRLVKQKPNAVLGLATGSSPTGMYQEMIRDHQENGTTYRQIKTVNLDEYVGLDPKHPNSYHYFMVEKLFRHIDLPIANTNVPNGKAADMNEECRRYDALIQALGGVDLQVLGIGRNGHIGFNEPGTPFETKTHVVALAHDTRKANARFFNSFQEVPTQAVTMGIQNILESKAILLLVSGTSKAEAMARLLKDTNETEAFPASALHRHDNVTIIADADALSLVYDLERRA
ncbi:glucosamine-6-phosphate deaminase [Camelliibacillus cellulosilyticus]|uniref:Glucosamine-6-phosphate deaminase n=1 Tax=Camelliibacillus cellulosilyticus TaxID=2174486 RepID=A0ABV9GJW1_9BACL